MGKLCIKAGGHLQPVMCPGSGSKFMKSSWPNLQQDRVVLLKEQEYLYVPSPFSPDLISLGGSRHILGIRAGFTVPTIQTQKREADWARFVARLGLEGS